MPVPTSAINRSVTQLCRRVERTCSACVAGLWELRRSLRRDAYAADGRATLPYCAQACHGATRKEVDRKFV